MYYDIVFHFDHSEEECAIALSNIGNYFHAVNEEYRAVMVVNGPGVLFMTQDSLFKEKLTALHEQGLSLRICNNALNHFQIPAENLLACCEIVPAGILEIVDLQRQDYVYIRP